MGLRKNSGRGKPQRKKAVATIKGGVPFGLAEPRRLAKSKNHVRKIKNVRSWRGLGGGSRFRISGEDLSRPSGAKQRVRINSYHSIPKGATRLKPPKKVQASGIIPSNIPHWLSPFSDNNPPCAKKKTKKKSPH